MARRKDPPPSPEIGQSVGRRQPWCCRSRPALPPPLTRRALISITKFCTYTLIIPKFCAMGKNPEIRGEFFLVWNQKSKGMAGCLPYGPAWSQGQPGGPGGGVHPDPGDHRTPLLGVAAAKLRAASLLGGSGPHFPSRCSWPLLSPDPRGSMNPTGGILSDPQKKFPPNPGKPLAHPLLLGSAVCPPSSLNYFIFKGTGRNFLAGKGISHFPAGAPGHFPAVERRLARKPVPAKPISP
jgi:hypothetical protein